MTRTITVATLVFLTAALAQAQSANPQTPPSTTSPRETGTSVTTTVTTTLVGCLYREEQIPGRKPNVAERAGILEDYVLADATMKSDQPGASSAASPSASGTSGSVPASGRMYKVERIPDERLKALVGKRVEVTGRIDPQRGQSAAGPGSATGAPTPDVGPSPDKINLPELEASAIREISGQCPSAPAARQ